MHTTLPSAELEIKDSDMSGHFLNNALKDGKGGFRKRRSQSFHLAKG